MKQLVIASTLMEIHPFVAKRGISEDITEGQLYSFNDDFSFLITGIGAHKVIFHLTRLLFSNKFERIIQIGIAGSFNSDYNIGGLVEVKQDCFADLGIDDNGNFQHLFTAGLVNADEEPFQNGVLNNPDQNTTGLSQARGITVNTASGSKKVIDQRISVWDPEIESMEGAAAFYVCMMLKIPVLQLRAISNMVEPRNKDRWDLDLAIKNLNNWLMEFVGMD